MSNYSPLSIKLSVSIDKETRKNEGIFFTSQSIVQDCIRQVLPFTQSTSILEPSCGSGEFISALLENNNGLHITGIEHNAAIYEEVKAFETPKHPNTKIIHGISSK